MVSEHTPDRTSARRERQIRALSDDGLNLVYNTGSAHERDVAWREQVRRDRESPRDRSYR